MCDFSVGSGDFSVSDPCSEYEAFSESPQLLKPTLPNRPEPIRIASEIDLQLIETLRKDGRAGGRAFAERTKLSEASVSRRIFQLEESGLVRVRGYVDLQNAGCNAAAMIRFSTMGSPIILAQALAKRLCCYRVATIAGQSEVIVCLVATTPLLLLIELEEIMAEHNEVVIHHVSPILDIIPPREARQVLNSTNEPVVERRSTVRRSHFQANLIRTLQSDFRMTLTAISDAVGLSGPSTSERVQEVIDLGLVRHIVVVDPNFLGTPLCAQLRISAKRDFKKIAQEIAETLNPNWIFLCAQTEQILVEVFVANEGQLVDWQHNIKKIPEVASVAYSLFSAVYKQDFNWFSSRPISLAT